jgi:outer membrane biosynthesis protein TonB
MYVTAREFKFIKYVANFHTRSAADEFEAHLKSLLDNDIEKKLIGVKRFKNSVIFSMEDNARGYILAKEFEEAYINKNKPAPVEQPKPEPIQTPEPQPMSSAPETQPEPQPEPETINESVIQEVIETVIETVEEPIVSEVEFLETEKIDKIEEEIPTVEERTGTMKIVNLFKNLNK